MHHNSVEDIRQELGQLLLNKQFTNVNREASMTQLTGGSTVEIIGASLIADEPLIFGDVNWDYVQREEEWYNSQSLNVNDIPGGAPQIWKAVADKDGFINSNYGWTLYSEDNYFQYNHVVNELKGSPSSRRAIAIYTRPDMWYDYNKNGRSDFMCTNAVQYLIRDGAVHSVVQMRSNDSIFGYRNDRAWQQHVLEKIATTLGYPAGNLYWQVGSLHVYARHFYLIDHFNRTGETSITKEEYKIKYPESQYI